MLNMVNSIYDGINVYLNYTGESKCFDLDSHTPFDVNLESWRYQMCTELIFPLCSNGKIDMFEKQDWDPVAYRDKCYEQFKIKPREEWQLIKYGGSSHDFKDYSNIIFSNGDLDPWSSGGVMNDVNEKIKALLIEQGAHHLGNYHYIAS